MSPRAARQGGAADGWYQRLPYGSLSDHRGVQEGVARREGGCRTHAPALVFILTAVARALAALPSPLLSPVRVRRPCDRVSGGCRYGPARSGRQQPSAMQQPLPPPRTRVARQRAAAPRQPGVVDAVGSGAGSVGGRHHQGAPVDCWRVGADVKKRQNRWARPVGGCACHTHPPASRQLSLPEGGRWGVWWGGFCPPGRRDGRPWGRLCAFVRRGRETRHWDVRGGMAWRRRVRSPPARGRVGTYTFSVGAGVAEARRAPLIGGSAEGGRRRASCLRRADAGCACAFPSAGSFEPGVACASERVWGERAARRKRQVATGTSHGLRRDHQPTQPMCLFCRQLADGWPT